MHLLCAATPRSRRVAAAEPPQRLVSPQVAAALWRVKLVEGGLGANGAAFLTEDTVTLRNLYGFALLEDEEPDRIAADMRPSTDAAVI